MEIIGRLTANAEVKTLKDKRSVVEFAIAINDSYKTKDGERKKTVTYINCTYWLSPKVAEYLTKGTIVSVYGRIWASAYKDRKDEAQAVLLFHVNSLKIISSLKSFEAKEQKAAVVSTDKKDDLPF